MTPEELNQWLLTIEKKMELRTMAIFLSYIDDEIILVQEQKKISEARLQLKQDALNIVADEKLRHQVDQELEIILRENFLVDRKLEDLKIRAERLRAKLQGEE